MILFYNELDILRKTDIMISKHIITLDYESDTVNEGKANILVEEEIEEDIVSESPMVKKEEEIEEEIQEEIKPDDDTKNDIIDEEIEHIIDERILVDSD